MKMRDFRLGAVFGAVLLFSIVVTGCAGGSRSTTAMPMAPLSEMPAEVGTAPVAVQEGYQFAVANPDVLQEIPCYCGCGAMGHTSNYSCYVQSTDASGKPVFDGHALGCSICVDITQDTMRLSRQGKSIADIQAYVDQRYAQYGPPTTR